MERQDAERIITDYVKPIYGFTLKRCKTGGCRGFVPGDHSKGISCTSSKERH